MVCMLYLGFDHFRGDLKNNIILGHILNGNYILLTYAESYWLKHVIDAVKARSEDIPLEDLYIATNNFFEAQDNPLLRASIAQTSQRVSKDFVSIPEEWHAVAVKLSRIQSLSRSTQTMQNAAQGKPPLRIASNYC